MGRNSNKELSLIIVEFEHAVLHPDFEAIYKLEKLFKADVIETSRAQSMLILGRRYSTLLTARQSLFKITSLRTVKKDISVSFVIVL